MNLKRWRPSNPWRHPEEHSAWTPEASLSAVKNHSGTFWEKGFQASRLTRHCGTGKAPWSPESQDTHLRSPVSHTLDSTPPPDGSFEEPLLKWPTTLDCCPSVTLGRGKAETAVRAQPFPGQTALKGPTSYLPKLPLGRPRPPFPLPCFSSCPDLVCLLLPHEPRPHWPSEKPYLSLLPSLTDPNAELKWI